MYNEFVTVCFKTDSQRSLKSYSRFPIHRAMLQDSVRVSAYSAALVDQNVVDGQTVLEVGCGTGILSLMAAKARQSFQLSFQRHMIIPSILTSSEMIKITTVCRAISSFF